MKIKMIRNEEDYESALKKLSELMEETTPSDSREKDDLDLLILVIQDYEQKNAKPLYLDPLEAIKFRMEQMHLTKKDLIPDLGSESKISEIFSGKRSLSLAMIRRLHRRLGIPLESLIEPRTSTSLSRVRNRRKSIQKKPVRSFRSTRRRKKVI